MQQIWLAAPQAISRMKEKKKKVLTNADHCSIISKLSRNAAIAQPVERILGKDEVASSNLASSSIKRPKP